jgi:hypothetical protein
VGGPKFFAFFGAGGTIHEGHEGHEAAKMDGNDTV